MSTHSRFSPIISGKRALISGRDECTACGEGFDPDEVLRMRADPRTGDPKPYHQRCDDDGR